MPLDTLQEGIGNVIDKVTGIFGTPVGAAIGGGAAGVIVGGAAAASVAAFKKRRKKARGKKRGKSRGRKRSRSSRRKLKFGSKAWRKKYHRRRHKHRSSPRGKLRYHKTGRAHHKRGGTKAIHYTKNGQPYVILSSGKARFISKRGARSSKKRKGGRY